ncbi:MAG: 50S ribosomal protein L30 [Bdellovibrionaceae bacterium]|nr:50S ribosomal protein L30 [Pseudobdellovibrionaceae bacterium]MBX3032413.1 50S ribosomal protein L30 [Pseudobdellovibrionaceae bacterium]
MAKSFKLTLKRSLIGCTQDQRETVRCLGLRKREQTVEVKDNPAMRGQILKVQHLVDVEVVR